METKICVKCKKESPSTTEYFHRRGKILSPRCKECRRIDYLEVREERLKQRKKHYHENKEMYREASKKWQENNKELKAKIDRDYGIKNKEKIKIRNREFNAKNREKQRSRSKRYSDKASIKLYDTYLILSLNQGIGLKYAEIKQYPELIKFERERLTLVRLNKVMFKTK